MDSLDRIKELFHAALERDPAQRPAFLDEACGGDASLKAEVQTLLDGFESNPDYLNRPAWADFIEPSEEKGWPMEDLEPEPGLPFERLGEFRIVRRLGEGGMGVVYLAVQESLNRLVALKAIRPERIGTFEAEARFRREVEAVAELRHPNIVTVFGSGEEKGVLYFAMELISGEGLDQILRRAREEGEKVPDNRLIGWIAEIASALHSAHQAGIIHRDVKPSNIRITPEGRAMLLDFGVARHSDLASLTLSGEFRGTPHYAAPEQVTAKKWAIDARSDVYSLGVTLYEAVTGRVPFEGETTQQVFYQILETEPVPPRRIDPALPRDLETVVLAAIDKAPVRRYQTAADFADDLGRLLSGEPVAARPAGLITRGGRWIRRHRTLSLAAAAMLLVLIAGAGFLAVLAAQQEKELRRTRAQFTPIREAMHWPDLDVRGQAWTWIVRADPDAPGGYLLHALHSIGFAGGTLEEAALTLEECIGKCRKRHESGLEPNVHYLLALVKCCLAADSAGHPKRDELLAEARSEFDRAGPFNPLSRECLVWRESNWQKFASGEVRPDMEGILINKQHYLVQLCVGTGILSNLFRGGKKRDFEEAIAHFERVVASRPRHAVAFTFMGRTYFFFARFFHFLELTDDALCCLDLAAKTNEGRPSHWIDTTRAQTLLLRGDNDGALRILQKCIDEEWPGYHNTLGAVGKINARKGNHDRAFEFYARALAAGYGNDVHIQAVKAELHLQRGETDMALESVQQAMLIFGKMPNLPTSIYSVLARAHLQRGEYKQAFEFLDLSWKLGEHSPRDLSLNAMLLATFPEKERRRAGSVASYMMRQAEDNADFNGRLSPTCLSGRAACCLLRDGYGSAIAALEKAIEGREAWPEVSREYYWSENARDRYFLAVAHFGLAQEADDPNFHEQKALALYEAAETEYTSRVPAIETVYLLDRVRAMARETLGIDAGPKQK